MTQVTVGNGVVDSASGLKLRTNGTTEAVDISTGQVLTLAQNPILTSGTVNGLAFLNASKVLTTGSALVFDGTNLGIGTSSPTSFGAGYTALTLSGSNAGIFQSKNTLGDTRLYANTSGEALVGSWANTSLKLYTNSTLQATLDSAGNLGLGVTPSAWTAGWKALELPGGTSFCNNAGDRAAITWNAVVIGGVWTYKTSAAANRYEQTGGAHYWYNAASGTAGNAISFTQAMTLDASGNLLVGTTTYLLRPNPGVAIQTGSAPSINIGHASGTPSGYGYAQFAYNGSDVGSITQNGTTGVLYNLTSDYRLKNDQQPLTGAKDFIMALKPKKWQWWDGSGEGVGFVAHEFMEVAKYSGQGEKDAVDADGKPMYQSIQPSSSEVMANLVAHIQELETRLAALESK